MKTKLLIEKTLPPIEKQHPTKIIFNYDGTDEMGSPTRTISVPKLKLFDEDEKDDDIGEYFPDSKLAEGYQSKRSSDPRFVMGSQFSEHSTEHEGNKSGFEEVKERELQMDIIEEVIGHKLEQRDVKPKFVSQILRYDPSKEDHQKFIKTTSSENPVETKSHKTENIGSKASKECYYKVSKDLTQSLHGNGNEFSLLSSFGVVHKDVNMNHSIEKFEDIKVAEKSDKTHRDFVQHFLPEDNDADKAHVDFKVPFAKKNPKKSKRDVASEGLFNFKEDMRLSQGLTFFKMNKKDGEAVENFETIRNKLRFIIHRKIARAKKKQVQRGIGLQTLSRLGLRTRK